MNLDLAARDGYWPFWGLVVLCVVGFRGSLENF